MYGSVVVVVVVVVVVETVTVEGNVTVVEVKIVEIEALIVSAELVETGDTVFMVVAVVVLPAVDSVRLAEVVATGSQTRRVVVAFSMYPGGQEVTQVPLKR